MWKRVKLPPVPGRVRPCAGALLGGFSTQDTGAPTWWGVTVGAAIGVFFGLAFGGNHKWRVWDHIFGPEQPSEEDVQRASGNKEPF